MESVFVIGTDTGVGKTTICAGLVKLLHGGKKVAYWKPVQTGTIVGDDTADVKSLTGLNETCFIEPAYRFPEPLSPNMAAKKWNKEINLDRLVDIYKKKRSEDVFVVIEGAGGILVPYNETELQIDLLRKLSVPIIVVAQDRVGAINQTLLTVRVAREAKLNVAGVILSRTRGTFGNAENIAKFGAVEILAQIPDTQDKFMLVAEVGANDRLRALFNVPKLPH